MFLSWIKQHGATLAAIGTVGVMVWQTSTGLDDKVDDAVTAFETKAAAVDQSLVAQSELIDEKLKPLKDNAEDLKQDIAILQADVNGISIAANNGAEVRDRLLSGKITGLQQTMHEVQEVQSAAVDTLALVQRELDVIQEVLRQVPDTLIVMVPDSTTTEKKKGSRLNPLNWFE